MKKPKHSGTRMEKVEGIRFADPHSAIYSTRLFVGSRHLGPMPGKVSRHKKITPQDLQTGSKPETL